MNSLKLCLSLVLTALLFLPGQVRAETQRSKRFAVLIGANQGDANMPSLRYAESDAQKVAQTLGTVGGFPRDQIVLMNGVNASDVRETLIKLNARLREWSDDAVLFVYYSGHADGDSLQLAGTHLDMQELRALLQGSSAATRVLVVDACRSGAVTRVKGGKPGPSFDVVFDEQPLPKGFAILSSSAATEDSQESDTLNASFFSHFFNAGLLGAADANSDGVVAVSEAFEFASRETKLATEYTKAGPQHPTFRVDWGGRQDLILTRPRTLEGNAGGLQFVDAGRYVVRSKHPLSGVSAPVAEVSSRSGGTMIALQPGTYQVVRRGTDYVLEGDYTVRSGAVERLSSQDMHRYSYAVGVRKGGPVATAHSLVATLGGSVDPLVSNVGWQTGAAYRQDRRRLSSELRLTYGQSTGDRGTFVIDSRRTQLSAAFIYPLDFSAVTVGLGAEIGVSTLSQSITSLDNGIFTLDPVADSRSFGAVGGPLLQLDVPFKARAFLRMELSAPFERFKAPSSPSTAGATHFAPKALLGLGIYL
jgi:hypothetical protein